MVADEAVTVTGSVAQYTLLGSATADLDLSRYWRIAWSLKMPDGAVHLADNRAALVRRTPHPVVTEAVLYARCPALDPSTATVITSRSDYASTIDEAWYQIINRLIESDDLRVEDIVNPSAHRGVHLALVLALVFEDLAARNSTYKIAADGYREQYEVAWSRLGPEVDTDGDGVADEVAPVRSPVWCM